MWALTVPMDTTNYHYKINNLKELLIYTKLKDSIIQLQKIFLRNGILGGSPFLLYFCRIGNLNVFKHNAELVYWNLYDWLRYSKIHVDTSSLFTGIKSVRNSISTRIYSVYVIKKKKMFWVGDLVQNLGFNFLQFFLSFF